MLFVKVVTGNDVTAENSDQPTVNYMHRTKQQTHQTAEGYS